MLVALAALIAGFVHVMTGPDHMAAIVPYATQGKTRAWRTGVRWGFGHSAGVLSVGFLALLLRDKLGLEPLSTWGERFVGAMLIGIGLWALKEAWAARRVEVNHEQERPHRAHARTAFGIGTIHGLAGSSHVLGIVPALILPTLAAAAAYLVFFGVGTIMAMGGFSLVVGGIAAHPATRGIVRQSALLGMSSILALGVGGFWLVTAFQNPVPANIAVLANT